jgi:antitoxin MazE
MMRTWQWAKGLLRRRRALKRIRAFRKPLPVGWKFDRDEANAR